MTISRTCGGCSACCENLGVPVLKKAKALELSIDRQRFRRLTVLEWNG